MRLEPPIHHRRCRGGRGGRVVSLSLPLMVVEAVMKVVMALMGVTAMSLVGT